MDQSSPLDKQNSLIGECTTIRDAGDFTAICITFLFIKFQSLEELINFSLCNEDIVFFPDTSMKPAIFVIYALFFFILNLSGDVTGYFR